MQMQYVRSFDVVASTRAAFFHPQMLDNVHSVWNQAHSSLSQRVSGGEGYINYTQQAADQAESALLQMAPWPKPYGKGGEVSQLNTLFEQLLEAQRVSISALEAEHAALRGEVSTFSEQIDSKQDDVSAKLDTIYAEAAAIKTASEHQQGEVEDAVNEARQSIANLTKVNDANFKEWTEARELAFQDEFAPLKNQITEQLAAANVEYDDLLAAKEKYEKLVGAIAADEVSSQFASESKWGRRTGTAFYITGFVLLAAAAIPLVWLLFDKSHVAQATVDWNVIIVRVSLAILAGSAATVAIRLGGRLINNANAIKRMELELRAIGPFLANVSEEKRVDDAFIGLVGKSFGNSYAQTASPGGKEPREAKDEATEQVTTTAQIVELIKQLQKFVPPSPNGG
jgi:hypothetical protein